MFLMFRLQGYYEEGEREMLLMEVSELRDQVLSKFKETSLEKFSCFVFL